MTSMIGAIKVEFQPKGVLVMEAMESKLPGKWSVTGSKLTVQTGTSSSSTRTGTVNWQANRIELDMDPSSQRELPGAKMFLVKVRP